VAGGGGLPTIQGSARPPLLTRDAVDFSQRHREAVYLETLDQERVAQLNALFDAAQTELARLAETEQALLHEKRELHLETVRIRAKEAQILTSNRFLEGKLAETLTLKEEQNIKLKSEIVIYRGKLERQKQKTREAVETFETKKINEMRTQMEDEVALKVLEIEQLQKHLEAKNQGMAALETQIQDLN
jgi:hypothetical protein